VDQVDGPTRDVAGFMLVSHGHFLYGSCVGSCAWSGEPVVVAACCSSVIHPNETAFINSVSPIRPAS